MTAFPGGKNTGEVITVQEWHQAGSLQISILHSEIPVCNPRLEGTLYEETSSHNVSNSVDYVIKF